MESDRHYFTRRAEEERAAGVAAESVEAREAHIEMAWRYRNLAEAIAEEEARVGVGLDASPPPEGHQTPLT